MRIINDVIEQISHTNLEQDTQTQEVLAQELDKILDALLTSSEDISAAIISSVDGHSKAQRLEADMDEHRFAAMSSALLALSDNIASEGGKGNTENVLIEGTNGKIFLLHAGPKHLLTVFTHNCGSLGMPLAYAKQATEQIAALMEVLAS